MTATTLILVSVYLASTLTALLVINSGQHRARGAVAWVIALVGLPWIALPLYWMSGQVRYSEYRKSRHETQHLLASALQEISMQTDKGQGGNQQENTEVAGQNAARLRGERLALSKFSTLPNTGNNQTVLYAESTQALRAMKDSLQKAKRYVLLQSYLLRDDQLGGEIGDLLVDAKNRDCDVFVLYDELGSGELSDSYKDRLRDAGVKIKGFSETRRFLPRLRMNFRNHRKILVVDGIEGFLGGMNLGDEYIDGADQFSAWRDTHLRISGRAVLSMQLSFVEDWRFANKGDGSMNPHQLEWHPAPSEHKTQKLPSQATTGKTETVTICDLGPHRNALSGDVLFTTLLEAAEQRLWIATPYFVPDDRVISTLKSAALRGVDVRVIVPKSSDHPVFPRVHDQFARELDAYGIKLFAFEPGFMHQKVMLIDNKYGCVGSANFDNRSLRLNFETLAIVYGREFCTELEQMLKADFHKSTYIDPDLLAKQNVFDRLLSRSTRLLSPVL